MADKKSKKDGAENSVEKRMTALYKLQLVDSKNDKLKDLRGELPLVVQDLEDEIAGLETRIEHLNDSIAEFESAVAAKKNSITESNALIKKYEEQQMKVRNNREFDSLSKEIEFQKLEIELSEKRIREFNEQIVEKNELIEQAQEKLNDKKSHLQHKKDELQNIIQETQNDEETLLQKSEELSKEIEPRLLNAYTRIRSNSRNGLAVVTVERNACGGCFNQIPPQRQLDVASRGKVIVCEHCGRILIDKDLAQEIEDSM